jgi:hypothetical protein
MIEPTIVTNFRLTSSAAQKRIQQISKTTASVGLSFHAKGRMAERDINVGDIYRILREGHVTDEPEPTQRGDWKCKVTLKLRGRRTAGVVVALHPTQKLTVVTVEWEDGK